MSGLEWRRSDSRDIYGLDIFECPTRVLTTLAAEARVDVVVESHAPIHTFRWFPFTLAIRANGPVTPHFVRDLHFDVVLENAEFCSLTPLWEHVGVYAVFTERSPVPFRACALEPPSRYKALGNFGFVLEFAFAGPGAEGWSSIRTPRQDLVSLAETLLRNE